MLPSPSEITYFLQVAETGNISRASERLGVTQPTLSLSIRRLEEELGVTLLLRGKSGVRLTRSGERFASQAKLLLEQWEKLRVEALREKDEVRGRFSIGCHTSVALYSLPGALPSLIATHPGLEITLSHELSRRITEAVISSKLDFGIVVNPIAHPDLVIQNLAKDEVQFWCLNGDFNETVLICDSDLQQTQLLLRKLSSNKLNFARTISSSSLEVVAALAVAGTGVAILPTQVAKREGKGVLKPFYNRVPAVIDQIALIYRADMQRSLAAKTIISSLVQVFRSNS